MSYSFKLPFEYVPDPAIFGDVALGKLYIGVVDGDPANNVADRIQAYVARQGLSDLAIAQPITLSAGGVPIYNGTPVTIKILSQYSTAVTDALGSQIYYSPKSGEEITELASLDVRIDALEASNTKIVNLFSDLGSTSGQVGDFVDIRGCTVIGVGGGRFEAFSGSVVSDGGTKINSSSANIYWSRVLGSSILTDYFGISGPNTDNLTKLNSAAAAAATAGIPLIGRPLEYFGVAGNFSLPDNLEIRNINLKQLALSASVRTIVKIGGAGNITIRNCKVNRNGTADALDPQTGTDAAGVWLQNFTGLNIDGLEVFGDGQGTGVYLNNIVANGKWENIYIHDMTWWSAVTPTTEKLAGMGVLDSSRFQLKNWKIENIYSKEGINPARRFQTDGLDVGGTNGCSRFTICHGYIANVGEGLDVTGSGGNRDFKIFDIEAEDCGSASFKFANGNNSGEIHGLTAIRSGLCGIGIVGTGALITQPVGNFFIHHCFIYDTGANPEITGGAITYDGIQLQEATTQTNAPFNTILSDLFIIDRQTVKTMNYGIRRYETIFAGQNVILGDNIIIQGAITADVAARGVPNTLGKYMFSSMQTGVALTHNSNGSWLTMVLATAEFDDNSLYNAGTFTIKNAGLYEFNAVVSFVANATGNRGLRGKVTKAPSATAIYVSDVRPAVTGDSTICSVKRNVMLAAGDTIVFEYYQNSGGNLNTNTIGVFQQVTLVKI